MLRFSIVVAFTLVITFFANYAFFLKKEKNSVEYSAKRIDEILAKNFDQTEEILVFLGKKVSNENVSNDLKAIHQIFTKSFIIQSSSNIFSWALFDWVNSDGYQVVSTAIGLRKDPPRMLDRNYRNPANDDWKIIFSGVTIGNPSGVRIIPAAVQVRNEQQQRIGTVVVGIDLRKLRNVVEPYLAKNIRYAVIDKRDDKFVIGSSNQENNAGKIFKSPMKIDGERYILSREMSSKYPYKIVVGYDREWFWCDVISASLMMSFQIIAVALVLLFLQKRF